MKILKPILIMQSICGLSFEYQKSKVQRIIHFIWNCCMLVFTIEIALYIFDNIKNFSIIFQEIMYFIGAVLTQTKGFVYLKYSKSYFHLYKRLCHIVNLRQNCGSIYYENAEKKCRILFGCFSIGVFVAVFYKTSQPLFTVLYKYLTGTLNTSDWLQCIPTFLLSSKTSPMYEIIYIILASALYSYFLYVTTVDSIFLGLGIYITYGFKDVQNMILDLNETITNDKHLQKELSPIIIHKIINCITLHQTMLECQAILQKLTVEIIFLTVPSILLIFCCVVFIITKRKDELFGITGAFGLAVNFMVLVYCYIGELITSEGTNVAEAAYNTNWYACTPTVRKYFLQLIQCGQKHRYFHGYFFHCSMETFSIVLKASFSIAAVMHNLEN